MISSAVSNTNATQSDTKRCCRNVWADSLLSVAEDKTKLIRFGRFARGYHQSRGEGAPATFDFLGFTHYCGLEPRGSVQTEKENVGRRNFA